MLKPYEIKISDRGTEKIVIGSGVTGILAEDFEKLLTENRNVIKITNQKQQFFTERKYYHIKTLTNFILTAFKRV